MTNRRKLLFAIVAYLVLIAIGGGTFYALLSIKENLSKSESPK